jgi:cell filamentation protein, protein adenylyltransferase
VLREFEALLAKGRAVGAKPLKEYMEVQGYASAALGLRPGGRPR